MSTADGTSEALVVALSASLRKVSAERERLEGKLTTAQGALQQSRRSYAALVREIRAHQDAILLTQHATREVGEEKRSIELQLSKVSPSKRRTAGSTHITTAARSCLVAGRHHSAARW